MTAFTASAALATTPAQEVTIVAAAKAAIALAKKYHVDMPIIEQVNEVLFEDKPAKDAVKELMLRDKKVEHDDLEWQ